MPDNFRPHRPTFFSAVFVIVLAIVLYHVVLGRKR